MTSIILASSNQGKLRELQALCGAYGLDIELIAQGALDIVDAKEDGPSFIENAIIKARHASACGHLPALADDSGLCVPILNHAPGIYSARYAGKHGDDGANNQKLLQALTPFWELAPIQAYFVCVLAFVHHPKDPAPIVVEGRWLGEISPVAKGEQGFGYDPIFWLPQLQKTASELDDATKNSLSHRAQASQKLMPLLKQALMDKW